MLENHFLFIIITGRSRYTVYSFLICGPSLLCSSNDTWRFEFLSNEARFTAWMYERCQKRGEQSCRGMYIRSSFWFFFLFSFLIDPLLSNTENVKRGCIFKRKFKENHCDFGFISFVFRCNTLGGFNLELRKCF